LLPTACFTEKKRIQLLNQDSSPSRNDIATHDDTAYKKITHKREYFKSAQTQLSNQHGSIRDAKSDRHFSQIPSLRKCAANSLTRAPNPL
jgi:hypothetical protein